MIVQSRMNFNFNNVPELQTMPNLEDGYMYLVINRPKKVITLKLLTVFFY